MAGCADCIAACPHEAISYEGGSLMLQGDLCRGCGACVGACPARAIRQTPPPPAPLRVGAVLVTVCARHPAASGRPAPACIQGAGLQALAGWMLDGVTHIACGAGDCDACPDAPSRRLADDLAQLAPLARQAGLKPPQLAPASSVQLSQWVRAADDGPAPARRALLRAVTAPLRDDDADKAALPPLSRLQAQMAGDAPRAFVPVIDAAACTGCDACIKLCPEGALMLISDSGDDLRYHIDSNRCTGCLLCEDVCTDNAIEVDAMIAAPADLPLREFFCDACGARVHLPQAQGAALLCPTCIRSGHHKKLFQTYR